MIHVHLLGRILEITGGGIDRAPCKRTVQVPSVCTTDKVQACLAPGGRCRRGGSPAETDISNATLTVVHLRSILSDRPGRQAWPSAVVRSPADEHDPPGSWDLGGPLLIRLILLHLRAAATPSSATPKPRALRRQPMTRAGRSNTHVRGPNDWPTAAQTACMGRRMARPQTQEKKHPGSFVCFRPAASRLDCPGIWQAWGKPAQWRRREGGASRMHARPLTPRHTPPARTHARVAAECTRCHGPSAGLPESSGSLRSWVGGWVDGWLAGRTHYPPHVVPSSRYNRGGRLCISRASGNTEQDRVSFFAFSAPELPGVFIFFFFPFSYFPSSSSRISLFPLCSSSSLWTYPPYIPTASTDQFEHRVPSLSTQQREKKPRTGASGFGLPLLQSERTHTQRQTHAYTSPTSPAQLSASPRQEAFVDYAFLDRLGLRAGRHGASRAGVPRTQPQGCALSRQRARLHVGVLQRHSRQGSGCPPPIRGALV